MNCLKEIKKWKPDNMSGECDFCGNHCLECICDDIRLHKQRIINEFLNSVDTTEPMYIPMSDCVEQALLYDWSKDIVAQILLGITKIYQEKQENV